MRALAILVLSSGLICSACLGQPIPKQVRAGTTFALPINLIDRLGFGVQPGAGDPEGLLGSDPQRGDVRFVLCTNESCTPETRLVTRYLARIHPDPASNAALSGQVSLGAMTLDSFLLGQPVAILDVPLATPSGTYDLRYVKSEAGTTGLNVRLTSIQILPGTQEQFTTLGIDQATRLSVSQSLKDLVPNPILVLDLLKDGEDLPAAARLVISHPPQVTIRGAFEYGARGSGSIVRVVPGVTRNTVSISLIDPDRRTSSLALVFQLTDANRPAVLSDFAVTQQTLYDPDGAEIPIAAALSSPGNRFSPLAIR